MLLLAKIRLIVLSVWVALIGIIAFQSYFIALSNYKSIELTEINNTYVRTMEAINRQAESLSSFTGDWAHWNESYNFMNHINAKKYIDENLNPPTTFMGVGLNYIFYLNRKGEFFDGRSFDLSKGTFRPFPQALVKAVQGTVLQQSDDIQLSTTGFISLNNNLVMLTGYPITDNEMAAKPRGVVIMGYDFDQARIKTLSSTLQAKLKLIDLTQLEHEALSVSSFEELKSDQLYISRPIDGNFLSIYIPLKDINKKIAGVLRVTMPRTVYQIGLHSIYQSVAIMFISGILILILLEWMIRKFILSRLFKFKSALKKITKSQDFSQRISVEGSDEITQLMNDSNTMLTVISSAQMQMMLLIYYIADVNNQLSSEITARKAAEQALAKMNDQMMIASRRAGMADVVTTVLHNIGNTLNSVNVSASLIQDRLLHAGLDDLAPLAALFKSHENDLGDFLTNSPKSKQIPVFLGLIATKWESTKNSLVSEIEDMNRHITQIKTVIASQHHASDSISLKQKCLVSQIVQDALFFSNQEIVDNKIVVQEEYDEHLPELMIDKLAVLQVFINVIKNALDSLSESSGATRLLTIRAPMMNSNSRLIKVDIIDNGIGISKEGLEKIFTFGYTTKVNGHGIGLHSSILTLKEMGGDLTVSSEGEQMGATFTLFIPCD